MTSWLLDSLDEATSCLSRSIAVIDEAIGEVLFPRPTDQLSPEERERISQTLWRLRSDLKDLQIPHLLDDISWLMRDVFGGPQGFVDTIRAWTLLIDDLVKETEQGFGSEPGRGSYKKRHVKAALLYLIRRSDIRVPNIPPYIAPIVWDVLVDSAIDFLAQFSNRHDLWGDVPRKPALRERLNAGAQRVAGATETVALWVTYLVWQLVFFFSPVSPALKKRVDDFLAVDPQPVQTVILLARFLVQHSGSIVVLSDLLAIAVTEGEFVMHADERRRKLYARELVLDFIDEETGLPERGSLSFRLLQSVIDVGIELIVALLEKHAAATAAKLPAP